MEILHGSYTPPGGRRIDVTLIPARSGSGYSVQFAVPGGEGVRPPMPSAHAEPSGSYARPTHGHPRTPDLTTLRPPMLEAAANALGQVSAEESAASLVERLSSALDETTVAALAEQDTSLEALAITVRRAFERALDWADIDFEVIHGPVVPPEVNVALDETLGQAVAAGARKPLMRVWEWAGTQVVLGSYQSYANELHQAGVDKHNVTVSRRISGGGTMYMRAEHSITFSLIVPTKLVAGMSFEQAYPFLDQWVMEVLASLGVKAHYVPLNDIASDHGKIAGAAQKRWVNGYLLHHVTMAYDMDTNAMLEVLRTGLDKVHDKGTRSAVKWVDPLRNQIDLPREEVIRAMIEHFSASYGATPSALTPEEIDTATLRCATKFSTPEWIYRLP